MENNVIRVLIVEDKEDDFVYVRYLLQKIDPKKYQVRWAADYDAGKKALTSEQYDVCLFDYRLGAGTGLELLREAINLDYKAPIILLTGADDLFVDQQAVALGAADYLSKNSMDEKLLERSIRYSIKHAATLEALRESQRRLELFMKSVPCSFSIKGSDGVYLYANDALQKTTGKDLNDWLGKSDRDLWPSDVAEEIALNDLEVMKSKLPLQVIESVPLDDGIHYWLSTRFPMKLSQGGEQMIGSASIDLTERIKAEISLKQTTQILNSIVSHLPVVVGRINSLGIVTEAIGNGLEKFGFTIDKLLKLNAFDHPDIKPYLERALRGESVLFSMEGIHERQPWNLEIHLFFDEAAGEGAIYFVRDVSEQKQLEKQILDISTEEQQRIGRDLHDGLGQHLTGIACLSSALQTKLKSQPKIKKEIADHAAEIAELVQEAIAQTRALARGLCPVQLENNGLQAALEDLSYQIERLHKVKCRLETNVPVQIHDHTTATHLYRIAQEAINNSLKHSKAKSIAVQLHLSEKDNFLSISDDGVGFDEKEIKHASMGLRMMRYRCGMMGGSLKISSNSKTGTCIKCHFQNINHANKKTNNDYKT